MQWLRLTFLLIALSNQAFAYLSSVPKSTSKFGLSTKLLSPKLKTGWPSSTATVMAATPRDIAISVLVPSSLGFYKQEYGVSYGYGASIAWAAYLASKGAKCGSLGWYHGLLHIVYGVRLCLFLGIRELTVSKFKEVKERIEAKAPKNRFARIPFVVSVAALYYCMSLPVFITNDPTNTFTSIALKRLSWGSLVISALGLLAQIVGDTQKYVVKAGDPDVLVTGGLFSVLRHPNYTGELFLWSFSTLAAIFATAGSATRSTLAAARCAGAVAGALGIAFVLALATTGLEKRQQEAYGGQLAYENWKKTSWGGLALPAGK
mmetsp:Transcript_1053/g.1736  ORF Transcript_1053/g.1736 Transcript_1053/m.1736 type:complete len:319 (+) Transcript_1053:258-1214(+)